MSLKFISKQEPRTAGILMPVASLLSKEGAGNFGAEAYRFVDLLSEMGVSVWQILPLNPLGYGNSPYQPFSSYAGDELYISLDLLKQEGLLPLGRKPYIPGGPPARIDYDQVRQYKAVYLKDACGRFYKTCGENQAFDKFQAQNWIYPYAVYMALKKQNRLRCWNEWPREQQDWILDKKYDLSHLEEEIRYHIFIQYVFYRQWMALKEYANAKGIQIMGGCSFLCGPRLLRRVEQPGRFSAG